MNVIDRVTLKTLRKNKTRTIVTIIGVILSAAMISAVTTFISSMQNLMLRSEIAASGPWQASIAGVSYQDVPEIAGNAKISESGIQHTLGYAELEGSKNPDKPYLYIQEFDKNSMNLFALNLKEGRMPEKQGEIVLSERVSINGGVSYAVGDTITLDIGDRIGADGTVLGQSDGFTSKSADETLVTKMKRTYTVVGIIEKPSYEDYSAPGYSAVTFLDASALKSDDKVNAAFCLKNPRELLKFAPELASSLSMDKSRVSLHKDLLEYMGISQNDNFNYLLYTLGSILIGLIMVGSISLIYNAFAISISERSKQFGMLSGVGATSRQIRNAVFFEAGFIGIIGIPIGILSGILGIGVTLYLLRGIFDTFTNNGVPFTVSVSIPSIAAAAVVGFVTILLSAWIPARRAARVSPIEAIKQTNDVKIKRKNVKTSLFVRRLFGMEGDIALKNFKRNRRRYRTTVISLLISIVLFISASSFSMYLKSGANIEYANVNYDIALTQSGNTPLSEDDSEKLIGIVKNMENYEKYSVVRGVQGTVSVDADRIRSDLLKGSNPEVKQNEDGTAALYFSLYTVDDKEFQSYLDKLGLDSVEYTDTAHPKGIAVDTQQYYDNKGKINGGHLFKSRPDSVLELHNSHPGDSSGTAQVSVPLEIGTIASDTPLGIESSNYAGNRFIIVVSGKVFSSCFGSFPDADSIPMSIGIKTSQPDAVDKSLQTELRNQGLANIQTQNIDGMLRNTRNALLVIDVFTYGFIILITLITIANVFNTISTNVNLRRREFAMLKSVGMTPRGFNRMIDFECIIYGLKALLYGLPVSLLITYLIYSSMAHVVGVGFQIPWLNVLISIVAVFLIIFITMMYSMSKVRKENIIDALKNENQ